MSDRVLRNSFLAGRCFGSGTLAPVLPIGFALPGRDGTFSARFRSDLVPWFPRLVSIVAGWQVVRCASVLSLRSFRFLITFLFIFLHGASVLFDCSHFP